MQAAFFRVLDNLVEIAMTRLPERRAAGAPVPDTLAVIEQARQEWLNSDHYFDCVSDPELIDHAILLKEAAQKKYMYLLRQARLAGLRAYSPDLLADTADNLVVAPQSTLAEDSLARN